MIETKQHPEFPETKFGLKGEAAQQSMHRVAGTLLSSAEPLSTKTQKQLLGEILTLPKTVRKTPLLSREPKVRTCRHANQNRDYE